MNTHRCFEVEVEEEIAAAEVASSYLRLQDQSTILTDPEVFRSHVL